MITAKEANFTASENRIIALTEVNRRCALSLDGVVADAIAQGLNSCTWVVECTVHTIEVVSEMRKQLRKNGFAVRIEETTEDQMATHIDWSAG
jgi:hypothetical protein